MSYFYNIYFFFFVFAQHPEMPKMNSCTETQNKLYIDLNIIMRFIAAF